jgi:Holliday junction resolvase RusA-like endonuclease
MPKLLIEHPYAAKPQGSKNGFIRGGRVVMVEASKDLKVARQALSERIAIEAYQDKWVVATKEIPVSVSLVFVFTRPQSALKRMFHTVKPDVDKLTRYCLDAISDANNIWVDDSQVVDLTARKIYGNTEKTFITISYGENDND